MSSTSAETDVEARSEGWLDAARERVRVFAQYDHAFEEKADVVVVGSGPVVPSPPTNSPGLGTT